MANKNEIRLRIFNHIPRSRVHDGDERCCCCRPTCFFPLQTPKLVPRLHHKTSDGSTAYLVSIEVARTKTRKRNTCGRVVSTSGSNYRRIWRIKAPIDREQPVQ